MIVYSTGVAGHLKEPLTAFPGSGRQSNVLLGVLAGMRRIGRKTSMKVYFGLEPGYGTCDTDRDLAAKRSCRKYLLSRGGHQLDQASAVLLFLVRRRTSAMRHKHLTFAVDLRICKSSSQDDDPIRTFVAL